MFAFTKPPWISTLHTRLFYNNKLAPNCYNHTNCVLQQLVFFYFLVKIISRNGWTWVLCKSRQVPDINELILTLKEYTHTKEVFSLLNIRCSVVISHLLFEERFRSRLPLQGLNPWFDSCKWTNTIKEQLGTDISGSRNPVRKLGWPTPLRTCKRGRQGSVISIL